MELLMARVTQKHQVVVRLVSAPRPIRQMVRLQVAADVESTSAVAAELAAEMRKLAAEATKPGFSLWRLRPVVEVERALPVALTGERSGIQIPDLAVWTEAGPYRLQSGSYLLVSFILGSDLRAEGRNCGAPRFLLAPLLLAHRRLGRPSLVACGCLSASASLELLSTHSSERKSLGCRRLEH
jgi:hypothetical protein